MAAEWIGGAANVDTEPRWKAVRASARVASIVTRFTIPATRVVGQNLRGSRDRTERSTRWSRPDRRNVLTIAGSEAPALRLQVTSPIASQCSSKLTTPGWQRDRGG